ncbi:aminoglycoside phosphotransferase [Streptomyces stramineus]
MFVKGVPAGYERGRSAQSWEVALNPAVVGVSPRLLWRVEAAGWDLLGFEFVPGAHADLSPGSPDLPAVADVLTAAGGRRAPAGVPPLTDRWSDLDEEDLVLLAGDTLLHTDTNPHNLLVGAGRGWLVDWALPAAGPAWVDVAFTALRLMECGEHSPESALDWAHQFDCWAGVDPRALAALEGATRRHRVAAVGERGARWANGVFASLLEAHVHAAAR